MSRTSSAFVSGKSLSASRSTPPPLGLCSATALVIASMIGTGLFTTSGFLLTDLKTPSNVLWVWAGGGVLAILGALCYGALARVLPESGGEYLFLSRTVHPSAGYVAGWISFLVGFSAPVAFAAEAFGQYSKVWWPSCPARVSGSLLLILVSLVHGAHVQRGAWVQNLAVLLKLMLLAGFVVLAFSRLRVSRSTPTVAPGLSTWAVALMWVSFSYSGWNAAVYLAGEVRAPERNLPRALLAGTVLVALCYLLVNAAFVFSAPTRELAGKPDIGRVAAEALGGVAWGQAISSLVALVLVSSISAQVMAGPRVYAKMAADGYLPRWLIMRVQPPRTAIALQGAAALAMLWTASFEWFLTYIGFTLGLSTAAAVLGLMKLRRRRGPSVVVPGWPVVPLVFLLSMIGITVLSVFNQPTATAMGLGTVVLSWGMWRAQTRLADTAFIVRGGLWVIGQSLLMLGAVVLAIVFHGSRFHLALVLSGALLIAVGAFFGLAGVFALAGNRTPFPRPREGSRLIRHGIYARVRHPLYTSVILVASGWTLAWGSLVGLPLVLVMMPFFYAKSKTEERWLRCVFPDYADYARQVPRFLPWLF